ncbi:MAG: cytochrome c nitrite reductase small subunit [Acidobacteriota bacterium]|nr:cytochrome c nitrite reductase small subunit [Acidobacteriota bacterium]
MKQFPLIAFAVFALGAALGTGIYTFYYAEGGSYFSTDPAACANCHIMWPQYESWLKSSHKNTAACVDCHLPHHPLGKYIAKAENGYFHSKAFTLQDFHEPIMIREKNSRILRENCLRCHGDLVHGVNAPARSGSRDPGRFTCVHCHADVGHGETLGMGVLSEYKGRKGLKQLKQKLATEAE